ncbi:MAG: hypothetical protein ACMX3H_06215 [Sodalis sp. (in: enterobacteria)]|uniref:hypothetical protein n=1 Tax=Sodalis sp. (in: enterobacteria) TaxID=1898979 RepID=UPI0039E60DF3
MEHILTGPYNKPTNNSRRPPRGAYYRFRPYRSSAGKKPAEVIVWLSPFPTSDEIIKE